jgi:hypothetical protein
MFASGGGPAGLARFWTALVDLWQGVCWGRLRFSEGPPTLAHFIGSEINSHIL